jgi:uncharacterized protein (TIGR02246 family)
MRSPLSLFVPLLALLLLAACRHEAPHRVSVAKLAQDYTAAWCSQHPERVASFYAADGSIAINGGTPSVGRPAITEMARGFMTAFPDMVVKMDDLHPEGGSYVYRWTLTGTNTGPGGGGKPVRISGQERWKIDDDGLIKTSLGSFDAAEYERQLKEGAPPEPPKPAPHRPKWQ